MVNTMTWLMLLETGAVFPKSCMQCENAYVKHSNPVDESRFACQGCSLLTAHHSLLATCYSLLCTHCCIFQAGQAERFIEGGLQTASGQHIAADLVIYATGFDRKYDYLSKDVLKQLHQTEEGTPLYRDTLHVQVICTKTLTCCAMFVDWCSSCASETTRSVKCHWQPSEPECCLQSINSAINELHITLF